MLALTVASCLSRGKEQSGAVWGITSITIMSTSQGSTQHYSGITTITITSTTQDSPSS